MRGFFMTDIVLFYLTLTPISKIDLIIKLIIN